MEYRFWHLLDKIQCPQNTKVSRLRAKIHLENRQDNTSETLKAIIAESLLIQAVIISTG